MIPTIDGRVHHFESRGLYDGLSLLWDAESNSWWNHVTGEAVYGPLKGTVLPISNLLHMTVQEALDEYPDIAIAISDREIRDEWSPRTRKGSRLSAFFRRTMGIEDDRVERMDIGLGIWNAENGRYYSMDDIVAADRVILDAFAGRRVLVYISKGSNAPMAIFTDATSARWEGDELHLSTGAVIRGGAFYDASGTNREMERPLQIFTRWYGFSLTFPGADVYER